MGLQNLTTVQALLSLVQYYFRAPTESPIWDIVGAALRLCVRRRYHRKTTSSPNAKGLDPYTIELQKRFFWCTYCFDRFVPPIFIPIWSLLHDAFLTLNL